MALPPRAARHTGAPECLEDTTAVKAPGHTSAMVDFAKTAGVGGWGTMRGGSNAARSRCALVASKVATIACLALAMCSAVMFAGDAAVAQDQGGSFRGTLFGRDDIRLANARVWLVTGDDYFFAEAITASDGSYALDNVPPGTYKLKSSDFGVARELGGRQLATFASDSPDGTPTTFTVVPGSAFHVDIHMRWSALFAGTVRKSTGGPAAGVAVMYYSKDWLRGWVGNGGAVTDANGRWVMSPPAGDYKISYERFDEASADPNLLPCFSQGAETLDQTAIIPASDGTTVTIDDTMPVGAQIDVACSYRGAPQPAARASLYRRDDTTGSWNLFCDAPFRAIPPGTYRMGAMGTGDGAGAHMRTIYYPDCPTLETAQDITVSYGTRRSLNVPAYDVEAISGHVYSRLSGLPIPHVVVDLWQESADGSWKLCSTQQSDSSTGAYDFEDLGTGTFRLTLHDDAGVFDDLGFPDGASLDGADDIPVVRGGRLTADPRMRPELGVVSGVVTDSDTGLPIPGAVLTIHRPSLTDTWFSVVPTATITADSSGHFEFSYEKTRLALIPVDPTGAHCYLLDDFRALAIQVVPGGRVSRDLVMVSRPRVTGIVVDDATGKPLNKIALSIQYQFPPLTFDAAPGALSAFDGSFQMYADPSGPAYLVAEDPAGRYVRWMSLGALPGTDAVVAVQMHLDPGRVDTAAPTTRCDAQPSYAAPARVSLQATDGVSGTGVAHVYYILDRGPVCEGTSVAVSGFGTHTITYWSVDVAGNKEAPHTATVVIARPPATVRTPIAPSSMRRGRGYSVYGYVSPRHSSGTYLVTLKFYRRNSRGVYVYDHSVSARRYSDSSATSKYKASVTLSSRGVWRVRAYHSCGVHSGSYSGYDYITVK
jgi:hypothetical protein